MSLFYCFLLFYFLFCEKYVIYTVFIDEGKENSHETEISFETKKSNFKNPKNSKNEDKKLNKNFFLFYSIKTSNLIN